MSKKLIIVLLFIGAVNRLSGQEVSGRITSTEDQLGIPGVNILIKGTTRGTISDLDGNYTISATSNDTLVYSFIGYITQEYLVEDKTQIDVLLEPSIKTLTEVVVTALGIKREEKALGYSIQKVDGDDIAKVKELDVVNALSGKVAGVSIMQADGKVGGGGSRIVIRGENSLAGNNTPLFIINGVRGDANDIAPDDIESISVLKGPAAAALYGAEAGAGVVLITSKSGKGTEGVQISFNSNITFQTPSVLPKYQNNFGMGSGGNYSYYDGTSGDYPFFDDVAYNWGPEFDGETRSQFTGEDPWIAQPDNVKDFYDIGHIYTNNLAVAGSNDHGNYRFSYTNTDQAGIIPNTGLTKNNFGLASSFKINNKLTINSNLNYIRTKCDNNQSVDVRFIQRNIDTEALKDYWVPGLEGFQQNHYQQTGNNPYFVLYENTRAYTKNKAVANISLSYTPLQGLDVMGRFGTNYNNSEYHDKNAYSNYKSESPKDKTGYYKHEQNNRWDRTADFLVSYEREVFNGFKAKASFGGNHYRNEYTLLNAGTFYLTNANNDLYNLNAREAWLSSLDDKIEKYEINSLYAFINLDYKSKLFLDITRRDDWSSRLGDANNHFNYPSASLSALISKIFTLPDAISFWKIRGNISEVGKDIPVPYFIIEDKYSYVFTNDGLVKVEPTDTWTDPDLKPEITTGYEVGSDIRLYNNRLGFDITVYSAITRNQILKIPTASGADQGKKYQIVNAGKVKSKGIELTINATPVKKNDLTWNTQLNWSIDRTSILDINADVEQTTKEVNKHLYIVNREDERVGTFYGKSYIKYNGAIVYADNGDTRTTDEVALGNYNPDWMGSWSNDISYKNLSLSFLLDLRWGGLLFNEIERKLNMKGLSETTLLNNREGIVPDGLVEREDGSYTSLTLEDLEKYGKIGGMSGQEYWATKSEEAVPENSLVNATYLKFRELRLAYSLPPKWLEKTFIEDMTVAVVGRNLWVWTGVKHIDPETYGVGTEKNDFGLDNKVPGYANASVPSVRSLGVTLNCKF